MQQISKLDPKLLLAVIVALLLLLGYSLTRQPINNANSVLASEKPVPGIPAQPPITGADDGIQSVDAATAVIAQYQGISEKPQVSRIGRNLFRDETRPGIEPSFEAKASNIELTTAVPASAYLQTEPLNLVVRGIKLKPKMSVLVNGQPVATDFINERELQAILPVEMLNSPRRLRVEVRDPEQATTRSNSLTVTITAPPPPPFIFTGLVSEAGGANTRVILLTGKEQLSARVGELVDNRWRLVTVSGDYLTVDDQQLHRRHQLRKGEAAKVEPIKEELVEKSVGVQENSTPARVNQPAATTLSPDLYSRPQRPMTHAELLQKRAEAKKKR